MLLLLQVFVFNHIHILGYATPMPYVYILVLLPSDTQRWVYIALGFAMGFMVDLFTNTPGMAGASMCATGLLAPLFLKLLSPAAREDEAFVPSARTMEWNGFFLYCLCLALINTFIYFCIEAFSFFNWLVMLISIASTTAITLLFMTAIEAIRFSNMRKAGNTSKAGK